MRAINRKNRINGSNTKNHAMAGVPDLHIKFNIHVQNNTYNIFTTNTSAVLGTLQL